jgi:hypothetical protein|tara:strand:- start:486 stop:773 length:288 start_codon:yes stop_codon:yes gene_type:complete
MNKNNKVLKLSLNEELLLLQSLSYRIEYYKDLLVQRPDDKLYKKCLKDLKSLEKTFETLLGRTKRNNPVKLPSKQMASVMAKGIIAQQVNDLNSE